MIQTSRKSGHIDIVTCAAAHRLGLACNGVQFAKSGAFHDKLNFYWCADHSVRGKLLNWASEHSYPGITFCGEDGRPYRIGSLNVRPDTNKGMWIMAIVAGSDEAIMAAEKYVDVIAEPDEE